MGSVHDALSDHLDVDRMDVKLESHLLPLEGGDEAAKATIRVGAVPYNAPLCESSRPVDYATSEVSEDSMNPNNDKYTPPESPVVADLTTDAAGLQKLSLRDALQQRDTITEPDPDFPVEFASPAKRPYSESLSHNSDRQPSPSKASRARGAFTTVSPRSWSLCRPDRISACAHRDPGYGSRQNTVSQAQGHHGDTATLQARTERYPRTAARQECGTQTLNLAAQVRVLTLPEKVVWPGLLLQPDSSIITEDQLTTEIKGIYAGLVNVEAKCIHVDTAQAADAAVAPDRGRWQALIALHRTLLYEHHDFLMATQHPSATPALRALPIKYSMLARMWKHGIHSFLEVLRHHRPASQEFMLSFIYLAYQMMSLLYETVPTFVDTWIECLGDLARYRMAIEDDKEPHAQWGGVAASWYLKASDRHPQVGRLYHHLAILERPSLRKFACYGKALTSVMPFANARDSLRTLCAPIAEQAQPVRSIALLSEAHWCRFHALLFLGKDDMIARQALTDALALLYRPYTFRWRECGVPLALFNISALYGYGMANNPLRLASDVTIQRRLHRANLLEQTDMIGFSSVTVQANSNTPETHRQLGWAKAAMLSAFHAALQLQPGSAAVSKELAVFRDSIAFVTTTLCFLHFLTTILTEHASSVPTKTQTQIETKISSLSLPIHPKEVSWPLVATYLNHLLRLYPVTAALISSAQRGVWPEKARPELKPLPEDHSIRGLVWAYFEFGPGWFGAQGDGDAGFDADGRGLEDWTQGAMRGADVSERRAGRGVYYGLRIANASPYLSFEPGGRGFWSRLPPVSPVVNVDVMSGTTFDVMGGPSGPFGRAASTTSASSAAEGDFVHVRRPWTTSAAKPWTGTGSRMGARGSYASVAAARTKPKPKVPKGDSKRRGDGVKVVGLDMGGEVGYLAAE
ncbi:hypothetical protein LTR62_002909 [Meristemomyces frigidus]|uniref:DNA/RNA-binding domain-containing protein n=1 Tax=Meristemomyces frigidus TaxID=1508187 RepID=A0AAN7TX44_9PEZI|nr:hypothetical protein LTR62_002909 [Meristemomyces frigidus]